MAAAAKSSHRRRIVVICLWLRRLAIVGVALLAGMAMVSTPAYAAEGWQQKRSPLSTPWTQLVGPKNALPEYPRPQMVRTRWLNLNGLWAYTGRSEQAALSVRSVGEQIRRADPGALSNGIGAVRYPAPRRPDVVPQGIQGAGRLAREACAAALRRGRPNRHRVGEQREDGVPRRRVHRVQRGHHRRAAIVGPAGVDRAGGGRQRNQAVPGRQAAQQSRRALLHRSIGHLADSVDGAGARRTCRQTRHHPRPGRFHRHAKGFRDD